MGRKNVVVIGREKVKMVAIILTVDMTLLVFRSLIQAIIKYLPVHILCTMKYPLPWPPPSPTPCRGQLQHFTEKIILLNSQNLSTMFRSRCRPSKENPTWT